MSEQKPAVEMVEVVALHDLSYVDHNNESQYKRQSCQPFLLDRHNATEFAAAGAVQIIEPEAEVDEFADAAPAATAKPTKAASK